ncbi:hydrogenase/urease accessory protein HupE [Pseudomonas sp. SORGH_AS 211]|nr:hydrogenase/urease accessory protein HupE [Pseudomonas sp. SORGH_AS_0211]
MKHAKILATAALLLAPALAFAHPGHAENGLAAGVLHPLTGLDHLLAMLAVGLWAAQQQGKARLALPCTFVGTMLIGGLLGFTGLELPLLETGIAASVLALGLLVALAARPPVAAAVSLTAAFALFHGVAHGLELPEMGNPWAYALGFVAATRHPAWPGLCRGALPAPGGHAAGATRRRRHRGGRGLAARRLIRQAIPSCWRNRASTPSSATAGNCAV